MYNTFMFHTIRRRIDSFDKSKPNLFSSLGIILLMIILSFKVAFGQTNPTLYNGWPANYTFTSWAASEAAGTYPANMIFWRTGTQDPTLSATANANYTGAYNLASGSRINGLGANGVSFVNTGTAGNIGMAVVGLNLSGRSNVQVSWTGGTVVVNQREYRIRLQYRIGTGSWVDVPGPIEYTVNPTAGHTQSFGPTTLPAAVDNQSEVYVRWFYYYVSGTGTRPELRLDDITISSSGAVSPLLSWSTASLTGFSTTTGTPSAPQTVDVSGINLTPASGNITITAPTGYEIFDGSSWVNSFNISYSGGVLASTSIQIRIAGSTPKGFPAGNLSANGGGAPTSNVSVSGNVIGPFTTGNIAVLRSLGLSNAATALVIDEFSPSGVLQQTLNAPTTISGPNRRITQSATATSEGALGISPDKRFITFVGYDANVGTAAIASTPVATVNRVVGFVDYTGSFNTSTYINNGFDGNNIRAGYTIDGNNFWATGAEGLRYVQLGTPTPSNSVSTVNSRNIAATSSQLYVSSASAPFVGINAVGSGFPTSPSTPYFNKLDAALTGTDPYALTILDVDPLIPGPDLLYCTNVTSIRKFSFNGTIWQAQGSLTGTNMYHITAIENGSNIDLYITNGTGGGNTIYKFTDLAAYNAPITSNGSAVTTVGTLFATAPAGTQFRGVQPAPENVPVPNIDHTFTTPGPVTIAQGENNAILYRIQMNVTTSNAILTGLNVTTTGTYLPADIVQFKLIYSNDANLDPSDPTLATINTSTGPGQILNFGPFGQNVPIGNRYLFVVADISGCAVIGGDINITSTPLINISYATANKTGTPTAGISKSLVAGLPANVTALSAPSFVPTLQASWTDPSCYDYVMVVVHNSPSIGAPTLASYTFNTNFNLAPLYPGGGRVVYQGTANNITVTNLPLGQTYYVRVFTRYNGQWSTGITASAFIDNVTYYSVASGNALTGAIWATTPNGTPATISSLGGFLSNRNIVIKSGTVVTFPTGSIYPCLNFTVQTGGQAYANSLSSIRYITVHGNIINNGILGNGTTPDALGFNIESTTCTFSGGGATDIFRIRKAFSSNPTSNLIINANINLRWDDPAAAIYNEANNTLFNVTVNSGKKLSLISPNTAFAVDGTDGASPNERGGNIVINGTLDIAGHLILRNNNLTEPCSFTVNATGTVNARRVSVDILSPGVGFPITLNAGSKLNVTEELTIFSGTLASNGALVIKSTAAGTGRINAIPPGAGISGNVTVERFVTGAGWHFLGVPMPLQTIADWNDDFKTTGPMPGVSVPNPGANTSSIFLHNQFSTLNVAPQIFGWEVPTTSNIEHGRGYRVWLKPGENITIDNTGVLQTGTKTVTCDFGGSQFNGFNLIANPHPAPVDFDLVTRSSVAATKYTYNPVTNAYETYTIPGIAVPVRPNPNIIPSHQGFFVLATATGSVSFPENSKATTQGTFNRVSTTVSEMLRLRLVGSTNNMLDETVVIFNEEATFGFDPELDAPKLMNPGLNIATVPAPDKVMVVNAMPKTNVLPLYITTPVLGVYNLSIEGLSELTAFEKVYLRDNVYGTLVELQEGQVYPLSIDNNATAQGGDRFELIFFEDVVTAENGLRNANLNLSVMPNPTAAGNDVKITLNGRFKNAEVSIIDVAGRLVMPSVKLSHTVSVAAPKQAGIYVVKATVDGKHITQKLVIE
jgi:hypothetical protein